MHAVSCQLVEEEAADEIVVASAHLGFEIVGKIGSQVPFNPLEHIRRVIRIPSQPFGEEADLLREIRGKLKIGGRIFQHLLLFPQLEVDPGAFLHRFFQYKPSEHIAGLEGEAYIVSYHYNHYDGCQDYRIVEEKNVQLG